MRPFPIIVDSGGERIEAVGNYIRLESSLVPIKFETVNDEEVTLVEGESCQLSDFKYLLISHNEALDQDIIFYVGNNTQKNSTKVAGNVTVDKIIKHNSLDGDHFIGSINAASALNQKPVVQLWNSAASGVNLIVACINAQCSIVAPDALYLYLNIAQLQYSEETQGRNKYLGGPDPTGLLRRDYDVLGMTEVSSTTLPVVAWEDKDVIKYTPIVIPQGYGLCVDCGVINTAVNCVFEWEEISANDY